MLGPEKNLERKLREAVMAIQLEQRYSKRTILERYLNTVYFGNGVYGVQSAARLYFGKDVGELDLAQSALLAGLIQAPESYNPFKTPDLALAAAQPGPRQAPAAPPRARGRCRRRAGHAADAVARADRDPLPRRALRGPGPAVHPHEPRVRRDRRTSASACCSRVGSRIETTLDEKWQGLAEQAIAKVVSQPATDPAAALVAMDPRDGQVRAYVGGPDYFGTAPWAKLDLAGGGCKGDGNGCRQAGSTFKPFVLARRARVRHAAHPHLLGARLAHDPASRARRRGS